MSEEVSCQISRFWAMPNKNTFKIRNVEKILDKYCCSDWIDPFAGDCSPAKITNDINPNTKAAKHMDGYDFLKMFESGSVNGVLFDPPYSLRQVTEKYEGFGQGVFKVISKYKDEIARVVKPQGYVISFGWHTNGIGKSRGFTKKEIVLIAHGAEHNDTIITVEQKND